MDIPEFDLPSDPPVARRSPSGLMATPFNFNNACPWKKATERRVATSQSWTVCSPAVASSRPELTEDEDIIGPGSQFAFLEFPQQLAACRTYFANLDQPVAGRGQQFTVGAEGNLVDRGRIAGKRETLLAGFRVEDSYRHRDLFERKLAVGRNAAR